MPALIATRFNPNLKAKYQAMRETGKPAKVAIIPKLIELANAFIRDDREWPPKVA
jgi:transposase